MNPTEQLDYALGRLDGADRLEADAEVAGDPDLADRLDRLGHSLRLLLDDGRDYEPPAGLAGRAPLLWKSVPAPFTKSEAPLPLVRRVCYTIYYSSKII